MPLYKHICTNYKGTLAYLGQQYKISWIKIDLSPLDIASLKFASLVVERVFSRYLHMLTDRRHGFTFDNLKHTFLIMCNTQRTLHTDDWYLHTYSLFINPRFGNH